MRYHEINSENSHINWLDDNPEIVLKYINDWDKRPELGDGDQANNFDLKSITSAQNSLRKLIRNNYVIAYRAMVMSPRVIASLASGDGLGQCWTYNERTAHPFNISSNISVFIFCSKIPISSIDWLATIALFDNGENEIRVKFLAPLNIKWIKNNQNGENIRPDLWGKSFKASGQI